MKKLLLTAAAILATLSMYAQGTGRGAVSYNTTGAPNDKRVWVNTTGAVGEGTLASGAAYQTALYWAPSGTTDASQFTQVGAATGFLTGTSAGTFFGGGRTITGLATDGPVLAFQSRAWTASSGGSWETATERGSGPIFELKTKNINDPLELTPAVGGAAGWRGYAIIVPEPSTYALGLLGAGALLMLRRRK